MRWRGEFCCDGRDATIKSASSLEQSEGRFLCQTPASSTIRLPMLKLIIDYLLLSVIIRRIVNISEKHGDGDGIAPSFLIRCNLIIYVDILYYST